MFSKVFSKLLLMALVMKPAPGVSLGMNSLVSSSCTAGAMASSANAADGSVVRQDSSTRCTIFIFLFL